jgi:hypothetical protein
MSFFTSAAEVETSVTLCRVASPSLLITTQDVRDIDERPSGDVVAALNWTGEFHVPDDFHRAVLAFKSRRSLDVQRKSKLTLGRLKTFHGEEKEACRSRLASMVSR